MFYNVLIFVLPCWIVNLSLNGLYVVGQVFPKFKKYDFPLDFGKLWIDKRRVLGNSTTIPGLLVALLIGLLVGWYFTFPIWLGLIQGLAVYTGHALGSFIKRRFGYEDGQFMPIIDHGDYVLTVGLILGLFQQFTWFTIISGIALTYFIHPIITYLAYLAKLHKYPS